MEWMRPSWCPPSLISKRYCVYLPCAHSISSRLHWARGHVLLSKLKVWPLEPWTPLDGYSSRHIWARSSYFPIYNPPSAILIFPVYNPPLVWVTTYLPIDAPTTSSSSIARWSSILSFFNLPTVSPFSAAQRLIILVSIPFATPRCQRKSCTAVLVMTPRQSCAFVSCCRARG